MSEAAPAATSGSMTFLVMLARALAAAGTPAHRLEDTLAACARKLGVNGQFFATPTGVFASMEFGGEMRTYMIRVEAGEAALERLVLLDSVVGDVIAGRASGEEALCRVMEVASRPPRYGPGLVLASFGLSSAVTARFFGGGWREMTAAWAAGLAVGGLVLLAARVPRLARLTEFLAAVAVAVIAGAIAVVLQPLDTGIVTLTGLIVLLPGLSLTVGLNELAVKHVVAGSARLVYALAILFALGFGVAIGKGTAESVFGAASGVPVPLPEWTILLALAVVPFPLTVLFGARPRDVGVIAGSVAIAFASARYGSVLLGPELGACMGAMLVGLAGNAYARAARHPAAVPVLPGILLLVPGTIGLRSVSSFFEQNAVMGAQGAFNMLVIAMGIAVGLLLANVLVPPERTL